MAGKTEQVKGQAKEAVGSVTGNKDLEAESKTDRQAGEAKEKVGQARTRSKRWSRRWSTRSEKRSTAPRALRIETLDSASNEVVTS